MKIKICIIGCLLLGGCVTTAFEWKDAQKEDSVEAYQAFIQKHPQSEYDSVAQQRIEQLQWNTTKNTDTIEAYHAFIQQYPQNEHLSDAKSRIEELLWKQASEKDSEASYISFLDTYPSSQHKSEADARIAALKPKSLVDNAKAGKLEAVKSDMAGADKEQKSKALMMALWGALYTTPDLTNYFRNGGSISGKRAASVDRETYVRIIQLLMNSGADVAIYDFRDFDSVAIQMYRHKKKLVKQLVSSGNHAEAMTSLGGNSDVKLVPGGTGLSAKWVAKIEGADDILKILLKK